MRCDRYDADAMMALGDIGLPLKKEGELTLPSISNASIEDIWRIVKPE